MYTDEIDREILLALDTHGPIHVVDIARTVDSHPITTDHACTRLHECGCVSLLGPGYYGLTDRGHDQLHADT